MTVPAFVLGLYLALRVLAALYRVIDLWYTIRTAWRRVLRGLVGWGGLTAAVAAALPDEPRLAFARGFAAYVLFLPLAYAAWHVVVRALFARTPAAQVRVEPASSNVTRRFSR